MNQTNEMRNFNGHCLYRWIELKKSYKYKLIFFGCILFFSREKGSTLKLI